MLGWAPEQGCGMHKSQEYAQNSRQEKCEQVGHLHLSGTVSRQKIWDIWEVQVHFNQELSQDPPQPINLSRKKPGGHIQRLSDSRLIPRVRPNRILVTASLVR